MIFSRKKPVVKKPVKKVVKKVQAPKSVMASPQGSLVQEKKKLTAEGYKRRFLTKTK